MLTALKNDTALLSNLNSAFYFQIDGLITKAYFFANEMQQPDRPDQQKTYIIQKGRLFTLYFMPDKLTNPRNHKDHQTNQP